MEKIPENLACPNFEESGKFSEFRDAWMEVIAEYNQFGITHFSDRFKIDDAAAVALYGFKAVSFGVIVQLLGFLMCSTG